jgi:hypothetical protein
MDNPISPLPPETTMAPMPLPMDSVIMIVKMILYLDSLDRALEIFLVPLDQSAGVFKRINAALK